MGEKNSMRILFATDIHNCHDDYYDIPTVTRMNLFVDNVINEYRENPFEALILLGDYSLDHWGWKILGSYIEQGLSNTEIFAKEYPSDYPEPITIASKPSSFNCIFNFASLRRASFLPP